MVPHKGAIMTPITREDIEEIYHKRIISDILDLHPK